MNRHSRYCIGIDLGTTNSVVAYLDMQAPEAKPSPGIQILEIPQLCAAGEVRPLSALPSFLYLPSQGELSTGAFALPWEEHATAVAGVLAREQGALVPGRQIASAKSWLCQSAVDRRSAILPWEAEAHEPKLSPVEASARYLAHLRQAWNHTLATDKETLFEKQEIVLTVPASFDEEARELTVEAARQAGLAEFILLEEPMAAFYAWIARAGNVAGVTSNGELRDGELVLICDIGGGTTDFSLIRVRRAADRLEFERTAIGEHLLLGGDNLDIALARRLEERLGAAKLTAQQRHAMQRACCTAKERLLNDSALDRLPIHLLGSGRAIVGQMLSSELNRDDVLEVLTGGFLPLTAADDLPRRDGRAGLRELGLAYASDPAITKHLAEFLQRAWQASEGSTTSSAPGHASCMLRPDAILFNGGFCAARIVRQRIAEAISNWFGQHEQWRPKILNSRSMESAVAAGASYYARVRRGSGVRIKAGSARTYYIATRSEHGIHGLCVLPHGTEEGTTLPLPDREFAVLANRPVSFTLYSSTLRRDAHGTVVALNEEEVHRHAPLGTLLRYGKKMREIELAVRLRAIYTEMGTLELWCESLATDHRWRLQFELRGNEGQASSEMSKLPARPAAAAPAGAEHELRVAEIIRGVFCSPASSDPEANAPEKLVANLEAALGVGREAWPLATIRQLCDLLAEVAEQRKQSPRHEVRWLNLFGFCMRPGFGAPGDAARMSQLRRVYASALAFPREIPCQVERLVLLRRVAGGLSASQQHELYKGQAAAFGIGSKRKERLNAQVERDGWRLLASLEHLPARTRAQLGNELLAQIKKAPDDRSLLWSLARLGARIPLYGPPNCVVPPETAAEWIEVLLRLKQLTPGVAFAITQLGAATQDRTRDIDETLRQRALDALARAGVTVESTRRLGQSVLPVREEIEQVLGDSLPRGMQLVTSFHCMLSITALSADSSSQP